MPDIQAVFSQVPGQFDWALANGAILTGNDLYTAGMLSLFSDRRALSSDKLPGGDSDPRGSILTDSKGRPFGSRLWLLRGQPQTEANRLRARDFAIEALQWLQDDGVVSGNGITTSFPSAAWLGIRWQPAMPNGQSQTPFNYSWAWKN